MLLVVWLFVLNLPATTGRRFAKNYRREKFHGVKKKKNKGRKMRKNCSHVNKKLSLCWASFNKICSCRFLYCNSWAAFFHHSFSNKKPRDFSGTWCRLQQLRVTNQLLLGQKEKIRCWQMAGIVPLFQPQWSWVLLPSGTFCATDFSFKILFTFPAVIQAVT